VSKQFVRWVGGIVDDILFNQSKELRTQLEIYQARIHQLEQENAVIKTQMNKTLQMEQVLKEKAFNKSFDKKYVICLGYIAPNILKFGTTDDVYGRVHDHKMRCKQRACIALCKANVWRPCRPAHSPRKQNARNFLYGRRVIRKLKLWSIH
jgi:hypothetical protein